VSRRTAGLDTVVSTNRGGSITCRNVVWATGFEGFHHASARARLASTWVFATEPLRDFGRWTDGALMWETARPYLYLRSTDDGRLMVGGEDEMCAECHRSERWLRTKTRRLAEKARTLLRSVPFDVRYAWAGTFSIAHDGLPVIAPVPGRPREWLALGYGGNGITFSAIAARLITGAIVGTSSPDLALFGLSRRRP